MLHERMYSPVSQIEDGIHPKFNFSLPTREAFSKLAAAMITENTKEPTAVELQNKKVLIKWLRERYGNHFSFSLHPDVLLQGDGVASPVKARQAWRVHFKRKFSAPVSGYSKHGKKIFSLQEETFVDQLKELGAKQTISGLKIPR